jgi:hypothetical protein
MREPGAFATLQKLDLSETNNPSGGGERERRGLDSLASVLSDPACCPALRYVAVKDVSTGRRKLLRG